MVTKDKNCVKIGCWNIQGMRSKHEDKATNELFLDTVKDFDIVGLLESHTVEGQDDDINIENFESHCFHRPKHIKATHGSGGIILLIKTGLRKGIQILPTNNKDYIWLILDKAYFGLNQTLHICIAYIPPADSTYSKRTDENILDHIESDIHKYKNKGEIILMGDLNARTGDNLDYIENDSDKHIPTDNDYKIDEPRKCRLSQDKILDERGKHTLEICIAAQLRILNGRKLGDSAGYFTCHKYNGSSVVDYAICSETLFNSIKHFKIHHFIGTLSDHCMTSLLLQADTPPNPPTENIPLHKMPTQFKWSENSEQAYQQAMQSQPIQALISKTENFIETITNEQDLHSATTQITNIYTMAAKLSLRQKSTAINKRKKKPWSTSKLLHLERNVIRKGREMANLQTGESRRNYFLALKQFRKERKYAHRHYVNEQIFKLNELQTDNPKQFWHILQQIKDGNSEKQNQADRIKPGAWYDYLTTLNKSANKQKDPDITRKIEQNIKSRTFCELDFPFHSTELIEATKKLKNNKTPGTDTVLNEMIKVSIVEMLPCLTKLFTKILSQGTYPSQWATGYVTNIHKKGSYLEPSNYRGITINGTLGKLFNSTLNIRLQQYLEEKKTHIIITNRLPGKFQYSRSYLHFKNPN